MPLMKQHPVTSVLSWLYYIIISSIWNYSTLL